MDPRDHLAAAVDDHGVGRPVEAEAVCDREPRVEGHGVGDVLFADEALRVDGGVLDVECQDLDAARAVALRDARQRRRLGHARLAPRRLEAQDQDLLADQIARVERALAAEDAHAEARRRRRGGERRDEAQQEQEGAEGAGDHEGYNSSCERPRARTSQGCRGRRSLRSDLPPSLLHRRVHVSGGADRCRDPPRCGRRPGGCRGRAEAPGGAPPAGRRDLAHRPDRQSRARPGLRPAHEPSARGQLRGAVGTGPARARTGRAQSPCQADGTVVRPGHVDVEPRDARGDARQQLGRLAFDRLRADGRPRHRGHGAPGRRDPRRLRRHHPCGARGEGPTLRPRGTDLPRGRTDPRRVRRRDPRALDVIHSRDLQEAPESSQSILETGPYAVELTDKMILDLARENIEQSQRMGFVQGDPAAILIVEYAGESDAEVRAKVAALEARRQRERFGYAATLAFDPVEQQSIWKLRKAGLGLLLGMKGDKKPIAFVEDTAVHPKHLAEFVPRFREIFAKHDVVGAYYGHCSVGCLHIRPVIDLKTPRGLEQVRAIADEITSLVLEFGGTISSEHGDGRARSPFLARMYGPRLMRAFRELKRAFDPQNRPNPGNIVDAPGILENLRYRVRHRAREPTTLLGFSGQGGFAAAVELCNGVGVCRKKLEGTMCPSYMATKDEEHSTRGRANALRAVLPGRLPPSEFTGHRLYEVMDLCLECKGCKAECPANVDMAKLKYEFLHHYYAANGLPLRNRLFGRIERLHRLGAHLPALVNWASALAPSRWLLEKLVGIDRRRPLPTLAAKPFTAWV